MHLQVVSLRHPPLQACVAAIAIGAASPASAGPLPGPIPATVERVVDGDTIAVRAHIWPGHEVSVLVRLDGVDAPELRRPKCQAERRKAAAAKEALAYLTASDVSLTRVRQGKYGGRVVARVADAAGVDLSESLLAAGHAVTYGAPKPWCALPS